MHEHECGKCKGRFVCPIVCGCHKRSDDPDRSKRPLCQDCYEDEVTNDDLLRPDHPQA